MSERLWVNPGPARDERWPFAIVSKQPQTATAPGPTYLRIVPNSTLKLHATNPAVLPRLELEAPRKTYRKISWLGPSARRPALGQRALHARTSRLRMALSYIEYRHFSPPPLGLPNSTARRIA